MWVQMYVLLGNSCICIYICMRVYMCVGVCMYVCIYVCMYVYVCMYACVYVRGRIHVYVYEHVCMHICICIYIYRWPIFLQMHTYAWLRVQKKKIQNTTRQAEENTSVDPPPTIPCRTNFTRKDSRWILADEVCTAWYDIRFAQE